MHKIFKFFSLLLTTTTILSAADSNFTIGGEFLYLRPMVEDSFYVIESSDFASPLNPIGRRKQNHFEWQPAFRLNLGYNSEDAVNDIKVIWSHIDGTNHDRFHVKDDDILLATQGFPFGGLNAFSGEAKSKIHFRYNAIDALLGQMLYEGSNFRLDLQGGLQYANVRYNQKVHYAAPEGEELNSKNHFWGIGPEVGLNMQYAMPSCYCYFPLSLVGSFKTALLVSKSNSSFLSARTEDGADVFTLADVKNDHLWRVIPMWDIRFGLAYSQSYDCFYVEVELGYEVLNYSRALQNVKFYDILLSGASFDHYTDLSFHGPYVSVNFSF